MLNFSQINQAVNAAKDLSNEPEIAHKILSLMDLTSLNDNDTEADIITLCNKAILSASPSMPRQDRHVAAICIYPQFVTLAARQLADTPVKIATVANFPFALDPLQSVIQSIEQSIQNGAQEIDVVFPYPQYLAGDKVGAQAYIQACKEACGDKILKVILETGHLITAELISAVSRCAILAGADFIKTSTGKLASGATLEAAAVMLLTIKEMTTELNRTIGFKASGGIRTIEQATRFISLADNILGPHWVAPKTFRLGASQLYENILTPLEV